MAIDMGGELAADMDANMDNYIDDDLARQVDVEFMWMWAFTIVTARWVFLGSGDRKRQEVGYFVDYE